MSSAEKCKAILAQLDESKRTLIGMNAQLEHAFVPIFLNSFGQNVPFLSVRAFRQTSLFHDTFSHLSEKPIAQREFLSSGSTQDVRATHSFSEFGLERYKRGAVQGFLKLLKRSLLPESTTILSLVPPESEWPQSSLAAMIAMFKTSGLKVSYVNADESFEATLSNTLTNQNTCVLFGTTFHHLLAVQAISETWAAKHKDKTMFVIDTGGTKGRTQAFSNEDVLSLLKKTYGEQTVLLSEYGMCELSSQAYSFSVPHNGSFYCNDALSVYSIDLNKKLEMPQGQCGFLGFIDENNVNSYGAIIVEDLGETLDFQDEGLNKVFLLKGRAPDASLKGCSLNVKESFSFHIEKNSDVLKNLTRTDTTNPTLDVRGILDALKYKEEWDSIALADLNTTLTSYFEEAPSRLTRLMHEERVLCIASANIPITWVYPARMCALLGAKEFHLSLPSLREDDAIALRVRKQIESLAEALSSAFGGMSFFLSKQKSLATSPENFQTIIAFGNDATLETLSKRFSSDTQRFVGLGDVRNTLAPQNVSEAVDACCTWFGRGCLTPVFLTLDDRVTGVFQKNFSILFESEFQKRCKLANVDASFWHAHDLIEVQTRLPNDLRSKVKVIRQAHTTVVDATLLKAFEIAKLNWLANLGGTGFVTLVAKKEASVLSNVAQEFTCHPGLWDPHCGSSWLSRLTQPKR